MDECTVVVLPLERCPLSQQSGSIELPLLSLYPQLLRCVQTLQNDSAPPGHNRRLQVLVNQFIHVMTLYIYTQTNIRCTPIYMYMASQ